MEIETLNEERLRAWCSRIHVPDEAVDELAAIAREVQANPDLLAIFTAFHQKTALRGEWHLEWKPLPTNPVVVERYGEARATLFYLLAYLAALPSIEQEYRRRGIDLDILHETFRDIGIWLDQAHRVYGDWCFRQFPWIGLHFTLRIFRLGRLQFVLKDYDGHAVALRHKQTGEVRLLCGSTVPLRADGYALGAGIQDDEKRAPESEGWRAVLEERGEGWFGHPVSPYGYALPQPILFPRGDWETALRKGDTVLDLHIPRGEKLTMVACRDSLRQAYAFFARHNPERPFNAAYCHTWFFTPQLQKILPPESNIVRFQREFYLYPYAGRPGFLWEYVFGKNISDPAAAPRDTAIRRAVLDWIDQGGELFDLPGLMFHGPDEWGAQPYMRQTDTPYPY